MHIIDLMREQKPVRTPDSYRNRIASCLLTSMAQDWLFWVSLTLQGSSAQAPGYSNKFSVQTTEFNFRASLRYGLFCRITHCIVNKSIPSGNRSEQLREIAIKSGTLYYF